MSKLVDTSRESLPVVASTEGNLQTCSTLGNVAKAEGSFWSSLTFSRRCRDSGTIPLFLHQRQSIATPTCHRKYDRTERALLRQKIYEIYQDLALSDTDLLPPIWWPTTAFPKLIG